MAVLNRIREVTVDRRDNSPDRVLFGTMIALSGFGLLMIYSATKNLGTFSMERQMIFVAAGLIIYTVVSNIDYREYRSIIPAASVIVLVLLVAVFFFPPINDVNRWIPLGFFNLQPAEFAKVVVIVALWLAWQLGAQATALTVVPDGGGTGEPPGHVTRFLESCVRTLGERGVVARGKLRRGAALPEIRAELAQGGHDLLVVGAPLPAAGQPAGFAGLVAELLQQPPPCPLLIVQRQTRG